MKEPNEIEVKDSKGGNDALTADFIPDADTVYTSTDIAEGIAEIYDTGLRNHNLANYAYPVRPEHFEPYRIAQTREAVTEKWEAVDRCSIYVHVPYCKGKCKFCPFVVVGHPSKAMVAAYVEDVVRELEMYREILGDGTKQIVGFDMGGGTPTILEIHQLVRIIEAVESLGCKGINFNRSIETTPLIAANEPEKLRVLKKYGMNRISMGLQSTSNSILSRLRQRGNGPEIAERAVMNIKEAGFEFLNLDLMYGFKDQSDEEWLDTLEFTMKMNPTTITLYRVIFKGTKVEGDSKSIDLERVNRLYEAAYRLLTKYGYEASYGQNMFCKKGVQGSLSSYLEERGRKATPYLGVGPGAQSMFRTGMSYNCGQKEKGIEEYHDRIARGEFPIQDLYELPVAEMLAKSIAISFYTGAIDLRSLGERFGINLKEYFKREIEYLTANGLMVLTDEGVLSLTKKGAQNMNGIIPLFYSTRSKQHLIAIDRSIERRWD